MAEQNPILTMVIAEDMTRKSGRYVHPSRVVAMPKTNGYNRLYVADLGDISILCRINKDNIKVFRIEKWAK